MPIKRFRGRPALPPVQAARVRAGLALLLDIHRTGAAVAEVLSTKDDKISKVTVNAVARGDGGPSRVLTEAVARELGHTVESLLGTPVAEISRRGAP